MPRLDERGLDEVKLLPFGPRHIDGDGAYPIIFTDDFQTGLFSHSEDRMLRRGNVLAIHVQKDVSGLDSSDRCGASRMNILKYPTFSERRFIGEVVGAQRSPARSSSGAAVKEAQMRRMKFSQEIAHRAFKDIRRLCYFYQRPVAVDSGLPIGIQLVWSIKSLL